VEAVTEAAVASAVAFAGEFAETDTYIYELHMLA